MIAADVMTTDLCIAHPETTVHEVMRRMEQEGVRHVPVVDGEELVGLVSDRDIARFTHATLLTDRPDPRLRLHAPVAQIMSARPLTVAADDDIDDVIATLLEGRVGAVPVTDPLGRLVGLVSVVDVLRAAVGRL
jgi:acetoin utilization protein AcuB